MPKHRIAVILEIESSDRLFETGRFNETPRTVDATKALRAAVLKALGNPPAVKRVVAVTGPELMKALLQTHEMAAEISGVGNMFSRPPDEYEPPDGR